MTPNSGVALAEMAASERESLRRLEREICAAFREKAYNNAVSLVDNALVSLKAGSSPVSRAFTAWALSMQVEAHELLDDAASAVSAYQKVVEQFGASDHPESSFWLAIALSDNGDAICRMGDQDVAATAYDEVVFETC